MKILDSLLSGIINDDVSGLTEEEVKQVQSFVDQHPACIFNTDTTEPFFDKCDLTGLAGNCVELTVTRPNFKIRYINSRRGSVIETESELDNLNYSDKDYKAALNRLVREYQLRDNSKYYYHSNRSTQEWRQK
jgi:hypothetical protein